MSGAADSVLIPRRHASIEEVNGLPGVEKFDFAYPGGQLALATTEGLLRLADKVDFADPPSMQFNHLNSLEKQISDIEVQYFFSLSDQQLVIASDAFGKLHILQVDGPNSI